MPRTLLPPASQETDPHARTSSRHLAWTPRVSVRGQRRGPLMTDSASPAPEASPGEARPRAGLCALPEGHTA